MPLVRRVSPVADGAAVSLGDPATRQVRIPAGEYTTPLWLRTEAGLVLRVDTLPYQGVFPVGALEVLSADPGAGGGVAPDMQDDFASYASRQALLDDGRYNGNVDQHPEHIDLDTGVGVPALGTSQSMRYDWPADAGDDYEIRRVIDFGSGPSFDFPEVWAEIWLRFSESFTTSGRAGSTANADYKTVFLHTKPDGSGRFEFKVATGGPPGSIVGGEGTEELDTGETALSEQDNPGAGAYWDGLWYRYRVHARVEVAGGDGVFELWIMPEGGANVKYLDEHNRTWVGNYASIDNVYLGANMNKGTARTMTQWWGPWAVWWSGDPGW